MIARISLVIATLTLAAGSAHADAFRCGKTFITFTAIDTRFAKYDSITIRKSDVRWVLGQDRQGEIPPHVMFNRPDGETQIALIDDATYGRVVECLD